MNKIERKDLFGLKEVPDIFLIDEIKREVVFCFDSVTKFRAQYCGPVGWSVEFSSALFSDNFFSLWRTQKNYNLYCRTCKRSCATGKDIDFCFRIDNVALKSFLIKLAADGDPCDFPIKFMGDDLVVIDNTECPKFILSESGEKKIIFPE